MLYGAAYYHEYQPYDRLDQDIELMQQAGLTVVRLGESTWTSWEPQDGIFEFAWMDRVIDVLHGAGIKVIFGTPTYAIPAWLHRKHPDLMAQYGQGKRAYYGARQNMNHAHAAFRFHAERVVRQLVRHYAPHPAIIGYQVDNETGSGLLYNPDVFQMFVDYLKAKFASVEKLNEVWGLTYWSHRLGDWADLWTPDGNTNPGYDLEWRRFQASLVTDLLSWEARLVREYARPDQFVTQCFVSVHGRAESDVYEISKVLDVVAINPYHPTQDGLALTEGKPLVYGTPEWMNLQSNESQVWRIFLNADFARGAKQKNYLVTEINAGSIGGSHNNYPSYDGQLRQVVYSHIARGANMVEYWHWHTLHYGIETYWGGVLNHDLEPGRTYREFQRTAHELHEHDALLTDLRADADVAFVYSQDSKYGMDFMPPLPHIGSNLPDHGSYGRIFDTFYRGFFDARIQVDILHTQQNFEAYPLIIVPALYIADDALLQRLVRYAENGGHLLLGFRSGYADEFARIRWRRAPSILRNAVGASYQEYSNLAAPLRLKAAADDFALPEDAHALGWADGLVLEGATALAYYDHPHFGRFPAIVSQPFGRGRVTYCGTLPDTALAAALAVWTVKQAGIRINFSNLPLPVRVHSATAHDGKKLWFFSNWSYEPQQVRPQILNGYELFTSAPIDESSTLTLDAWDTKIIVV
ncbi:MAG: beta-galactosidase [Chloroflexota bacterium]